MNRSSRIRPLCAFALALGLSSHPAGKAFALPESFNLAGRTVLIDEDARRGSSQLGTMAAEKSSISFTTSLTGQQAGQSFALRVEGQAPADGWKLRINGDPLDVDAITAPDGSWFGIPAGALNVGTNQVEVVANDGGATGVTGLLGFSLNFAEEERFVSFVSAPRSEPPTDVNQDQYDVEHLDLAITVDPASATIPAAICTVDARSLVAGLSLCVLDFNDNAGAMSISAVDSGPATPALTYTWDTSGEKLRINLPSPVALGSPFTVRVSYNGTPVSGLAYRRTTHSGNPLVYTNNQPYNARTWYPCKDLPRDKFTVDVHATVPTASYGGFPFSVVSNGTLVSTTPSGPNTIYNWSESYPIATQYVSLACSNYQVASGTYTALDNVTTMNVAHHVYPESYAVESQELPRTIEVMDYFADTFGEYPFLSEKYVTATWGLTFGVEHQTCTSMPNGNLNNPAYHRRNIHEMAHMWFGVCTGTYVFDHLWLSEGWASYAEALWREHKNGFADYKAQMATFKSSSSDFRSVVNSNADDFGLSVTYYKGAWVVHMLRHVVGDAVFFQATKDYLADTNLRYKTVVTSDFQAHMESEAGYDLDWFFDEWLTRASRPAYTWSWGSHQVGPDWYVDLSVSQTQVDTEYIMPIDFGVTLNGGGSTVVQVFNNQRVQNFSVLVGTVEPTDVTFDPDAWILCDVTELAAVTPDPPTVTRVIGSGGAGTATIHWTASVTPGITAYRLYSSPDGLTNWTLAQGSISPAATSTVVTGMVPGESRYFRMRAVVVAESSPSDVYGLRLGTGAAQILVVDGYDRWNSQSGGVNHDFGADNGRAINAHGNSFDTYANEALGVGVMTPYEVVVWIAGDESTADETFSDSEQGLVATYLENGGQLFATGNEIAWDLGRTSRPPSDQAFYLNYLKAAYVADSSADYSVVGTGNVPVPPSCFGTHAFTYGDGGDAPYQPGFPDLIAAAGGSDAAIQYSAGNVAGVQYKGIFGGGSTPGALVYLGFAFETVYPESSRLQMMSDVLDYFTLSPSRAGDWMILEEP
ncbi:hypothetical protein IT570_13705 [Candidatus Sumerlaeota bacterium]|nr:hypothetical protein [Candidatus Sumerlaeota bacterium]